MMNICCRISWVGNACSDRRGAIGGCISVYIGDLAGNIVLYGAIGGLAAENRHAMTLKKDVNVTLDRR